MIKQIKSDWISSFVVWRGKICVEFERKNKIQLIKIRKRLWLLVDLSRANSWQTVEMLKMHMIKNHSMDFSGDGPGMVMLRNFPQFHKWNATECLRPEKWNKNLHITDGNV